MNEGAQDGKGQGEERGGCGEEEQGSGMNGRQ